jgi:hypothetical protein
MSHDRTFQEEATPRDATRNGLRLPLAPATARAPSGRASSSATASKLTDVWCWRSELKRVASATKRPMDAAVGLFTRQTAAKCGETRTPPDLPRPAKAARAVRSGAFLARRAVLLWQVEMERSGAVHRAVEEEDLQREKASVSDEQLLQAAGFAAPSRRLGPSRHRVRVLPDAISRPAGGRGRPSARATPIDVNGHPAGVRCTDLHSETGSAAVRRHPARRRPGTTAPWPPS